MCKRQASGYFMACYVGYIIRGLWMYWAGIDVNDTFSITFEISLWMEFVNTSEWFGNKFNWSVLLWS